MTIYDAYDLDWTWDGDFTLASDGDLGDNADDAIRSLENEIRTVVRSELGDWAHHPALGANLSDFLGEANTRALGKSIEKRVVSSLTNIGVVQSGDVSVRVVPVDAHSILIVITVQAEATNKNRLQVGEPLVVSLSFRLYDCMRSHFQN